MEKELICSLFSHDWVHDKNAEQVKSVVRMPAICKICGAHGTLFEAFAHIMNQDLMNKSVTYFLDNAVGE